MKRRTLSTTSGFTLFEVLVALTILAVGSAYTISLMSASLSNIRKAQSRTKIIEQAQTVMEEQLLDDEITDPTTLSGSLDDGTLWTLYVEDYDPELSSDQASSVTTPADMPVKLLLYTVEMSSPDPQVAPYTLHTLKVVNVTTTSE